MPRSPFAARALPILLAHTACAFAQDSAPQLQSVTVTATRTSTATFDVPASVDVVDGVRAAFAF